MATNSIPQPTSRKQAKKLGFLYYATGKPCEAGHICDRRANNWQCTKCNYITAKIKYKASTPEQRLAKRKREWTLNPSKKMLSHRKKSAIKKGIYFDLKKEDIIIPNNCPCCNKEIFRTYGIMGPRDSSASIDRINPKLGYTKLNIAIICHRCNTIKSYGSAQEHRMIADWMDKINQPPSKSISM